MKAKTVLLLVFCCILISSCRKETEISGDVFVVTQGKENIKLGLVSIEIYPAEKIVPILESKAGKVAADVSTADAAAAKCASIGSSYSNAYESKREFDECTERSANIRDLAARSYLEGLPLAEAVVTTDADGKFSLKIPNTGKYVLVAQTDRKIGSTRNENYFWFVPVNADGTAKKVILSNNNLVSPDVSPIIAINALK